MVERGATLTHSGPSATESAGVDLDVAGDVLIAEGGTVDVRLKGYSTGKGPGAGSCGGHAALVKRNSGDSVTYGALASPTNFGSAGDYSAGGGRVRIFAGGTFDLRGSVTAAAGSADRGGAGGSVWIRAGRLAGAGEVSVNGLSSEWSPGPGRVAVETTTERGAEACPWRVNCGGGPGGGSFYFKRAEDRFGTARIAQATYGVRFGDRRGAEPVRKAKNIRVEVANSTRMTMMSDYALRDLYLGTNSTLNLQTYTLTLHDRLHKNGRNWGTGVTVTSNVTEQATGQIKWLPQGVLLFVR